MSQKYSFEPLKLRPFSRLDVADLGIEEEPPQPNWVPYASEKAPSTTTTYSIVEDNSIKIRSQPTFNSLDTAYSGPVLSHKSMEDGYSNQEGWLSAQSRSFRTSSFLESKGRRFAPTWITAALAIFASSFSVYYSYRVMVDQEALPSYLVLQPGTTVLVVNILSHVAALLCWSLFRDTMEALRWALACRHDGILLTSFLAMSRATPVMGVLYLSLTKGAHQIWAVQRILSLVFATILGLVLITNVTFKSLYTPYSTSINSTNATQPVVAGLAPISPYGLSDVPISVVNIFAAYAMSFITDPRFVATIAPVTCSGKDCLSIFLPGGMDSVRYDDSTGLRTLFSGDFPGDYTTIVVNNAPGYHIEYAAITSIDPEFVFDPDTDCTMYLQSIGDGLYICMVERGVQLFLGWSACPPVTYLLNQCQTDLTWTETIRWNTTVAMFNRQATVAYDSQNISILSIESINTPIPTPVNIVDFRLWCDLVLAPVPSTLNMTANETTFEDAGTNFDIEFSFAWILRLYESDYTTYSDGGLSLLRSFLAVPFQFSTALQQMGDINRFPKENHVTASLSKSSYRAIVEPWTLWVFGLFAAVMISWAIGFLIWISFFGPASPNTSFFPELDITSKSSIYSDRHPYDRGDQRFETIDETTEDLGKLTRSNGLGNGMSYSVVKAIHGKRVFCGASPGAQDGGKIIILVTERDRAGVLNIHERYG